MHRILWHGLNRWHNPLLMLDPTHRRARPAMAAGFLAGLAVGFLLILLIWWLFHR